MTAPERTATAAELADHDQRMERARAIGAVRRGRCPLCGGHRFGPCQVTPPGDHLARWLAAYADGRVTRDDLNTAIGRLTVIAAGQLVPERAS